MIKPPAVRFFVRVDHSSSVFACWIWKGARTSNGYGSFNVGGQRTVPAHRFAYELLVGPIPEGLDLDHLCRVRHCVNPMHLEPVTNAENILRGEAPPAVNARRDRCKRGHEFTPENTYTTGARGDRQCRTCRRERDHRNYLKKKASTAA